MPGPLPYGTMLFFVKEMMPANARVTLSDKSMNFLFCFT